MTRRITTLTMAVLRMAAALHAQTVEPGRLRAWLGAMPQGEALRVTLKAGEVLDGTFADG